MTDVAVDACCLINLLAANCVLPQPTLQTMRPKGGQQSHELPSLGLVLHVPDVVASESLYILQPDHDDQAKLTKSPIDLAPLFAADVLHRCDIEGEDEIAHFVSFASRLDDGEAACMALAKNRRWWLATLARGQAMTQRELAARMPSDPSTVRAMLMLLEKQGLVIREIHPADARARTVSLTSAGVRTYQRAFEAGQEVRDQMVESLSASETKALLSMLRRVTVSLTESMAEAK